MPDVLHLTPDDAREVPWKNGRGVTRELALWPEDASFERGDYDWRISAARVEGAGAFSSFAGFERVLIVTRGEGLVLAHGDAAPRARLRALEPYRFSGDWPTTAELVQGPIEDFNVIARRGRIEAAVQPLRLGARASREPLRAGHAFVHVLAGALVARATGEEEPFELGAGHSLWFAGLRGGEELFLEGRSRECAVLLVTIGSGTAAQSGFSGLG